MVTWENQGSVDAPVHLMAVASSSLVSMTLLQPDTGEVLDNGFQFLAMAPDTPLPTIPPGAGGSFSFVAVSDGFGGFTLEARAVGLDDPALASANINWEEFRDSVKPEELTDEQWDAVFDALIADLGTNWFDVGNALATDAVSALHLPSSPLYPRSAGVPLRIPMLVALGRVAADLGWIDGQVIARYGLDTPLAERSGRLLSLSVTISGYEQAGVGWSNLPGVRTDKENIHKFVTRTAQGLPGNHTTLHQPIGSTRHRGSCCISRPR